MARFSSACNTMTIDAEAQPREKECNRTRLQNLLRKAGLRPTQQRLALAGLLFGREHHHFSAEELHDKALSHNISVSQATILQHPAPIHPRRAFTGSACGWCPNLF
jgi:hypothetical protein